jgi:uncharacterized caspase-like protein
MRLLRLAVSLVTALFVADSALANTRVAFVVGNGAYKHADPLPNPSIDAKAMARLLRNAGFEVVEGTDLGREAMTTRLREFATKTQGSEIAVFFYAGHGMSVNGKNYLIPVDADLKSETDVVFTAIDVDVTLDQTMSDAKVKLVLLDACRDNPFAAKIRSMKSSTRAVTVQSGLAEMKSGEGTLIAFATSPGQVALDGEKGSNSPFTRALLNHIATPGVEIQQAMTRVRAQVNEETKKQQLPWGHTNLIGSVYLNAAAAVAGDTNRPEPAPVAAAAPETQSQFQTAAVTPSTVVRSTAPSEVEIEFWRSIKDTNKPEELNAYLLNYPNGQFRPLALARLAALDAQQKAPARKSSEVDPATMTAEATLATEDKLGLDRRKRTAIQKRLTALGFDTKPTGKFDDETREVIQRWQSARGYPSSGFFNKLQYQALMGEKVVEEREAAAPSGRSERRAERRSRRTYSGGGGSGGGGGGMPNLGGGAGGAFIGGVIGGAFRRR